MKMLTLSIAISPRLLRKYRGIKFILIRKLYPYYANYNNIIINATKEDI